MKITIEPGEVFRSLDETAVRKALGDPNPNNAVSIEIGRLVIGYCLNFAERCERVGYISAELLQLMPHWPIEAVAMELVTDVIRRQIAALK